MFVYLAKKIAIPNGVKLRSISWNHEQGWIACGGENGLLKVLKLEMQGGKASNNLSMNQTLDGHEKAITVVAWNNQYRKLTSSDEDGQIIVWMLHKGVWFEEMVNNRNRSVVRDLAWDAEGKKVCIVYEDGAVIVGSVEGNRLWGREFKRQLTHVTWSPDGRFLLFGTGQGEVNVHDSATGHMLTKALVHCVDESVACPLAGLQWYPEYGEAQLPSLAICYRNGKAQLSKNDSDDRSVLIDTGMTVSTMMWNPQGNVVAIGGMPQVASDDPRSIVAIQFYSNQGTHLRTLRIPGTSCGGVCWEGTGLRIAVAVDSFIYFANVRPDYKWAYFSKTVVYAFKKPERNDTSVMFWNVKSNEKNVKYVRRLTHLKACGDCCCLVSRVDDAAVQHLVSLCNSIGGPLDSEYIDLEPVAMGMNEFCVVVAGEETLYFWFYRSPDVVVDLLDPVSIQQSRKDSRQRFVHIDDIGSAVSTGSYPPKKGLTNDHICAVTLSSDLCFVARESGLLHVYALRPFELVSKFVLKTRAQALYCNADSTTLACIDLLGFLSLAKLVREDFSLLSKPIEYLELERKDVWDFQWASDDPEMFAAMEKQRMYVFRGLDPEEPVLSSSHICKFKNLKLRAISLDELMFDPDHPPKDGYADYETKSLRDTRELLQTISLKEALLYTETHPHRKLWGIIAEAALDQLDFTVAEKAVVRCKDFAAIQFVKRVKALDDPQKQRAEVMAYYHRFDEAERVFKEMDRKDLAVEMRARLGDWFRVVQLVQEGGGDESMIQTAWQNIGDFYADRQKWTKSVQYYLQAKEYRKLAKVYFVLEDYRALECLVGSITHDNELLVTMGHRFLAVGLADAAVNAFLKAGEVKLAVNSCVDLNQWDQAVHLAEKNHMPEIGELLAKYATHLVEKNRIPQAIELYRKAQQHTEAAKLLAKLGHQMAAQTRALKAKKFYVLAALEIEAFKRKQLSVEEKSASKVVEDLLVADQATAADRTLDTAWRGAEAFHFFLLCQLQLYTNNVEGALVTAMRLMDYDDLIRAVDAYSLIALTSLYAKNYGICSKAFTRLESIEEGEADSLPQMNGLLALEETDLDVTSAATLAKTTMAPVPAAASSAQPRSLFPTVCLSEKPRRFAELAVSIFTRHAPVDTSVDKAKCPNCGTFNKEWASTCATCHQAFRTCIASGRVIVALSKQWQCTGCRHFALESEIVRFQNCPLCHTPTR